MPDKPLLWTGTAFEDLCAFPEAARRQAGYQLRRVQRGLVPDDWKPMTSVGPGVVEIRLHAGTEHRVFYIAKFDEGVYVLHAFDKRTQQIRAVDIQLARKRLADIVQQRQRRR
jgi:phage-related protein